MGEGATGTREGTLNGPCGEADGGTCHRALQERVWCGGWSQGVGCMLRGGGPSGSGVLHLAWWEESAARGRWGCGHRQGGILEAGFLLEGVGRER